MYYLHLAVATGRQDRPQDKIVYLYYLAANSVSK